MSDKFRQYKRKLRWKSTIRKHGTEDWQPEGWDLPEAQNPQGSLQEAHYGPWRAVWKGGRLMDIHHAESDSPIEAIPAGDYDWQGSGPFGPSTFHGGDPTPESMTERLREWADGHGGEYEQNVLPYQ